MYSNRIEDRAVIDYGPVGEDIMGLGRSSHVKHYILTNSGKLYVSQLLRDGIPLREFFGDLQAGVHYKIEVEAFRPTPCEEGFTQKQRRRKELEKLFL